MSAEECGVDEDDSWLYGTGGPDAEANPDAEAEPGADAEVRSPSSAVPSQPRPVGEVVNGDAERIDGFDDAAPEENEDADERLDDEHFEDGGRPEEGEIEADGEREADAESRENGDSDSDDSEDDVKVILGDIKSAPQTYPSLNIKRGGLIAQSGVEKQKHTGKFSVEDFETVGTINGVPAQEFNIDVLEDKPWRKPGADLTDYFNYGFNEDTWRAYCERQKRMRINESGTGLIPLGGNSITGIQQPRHPTPILNDNSKYSVGFTGVRKAGPPPGRKLTGPIDVIGGRRDGAGGLEDGPEGQLKQSMQIPVRENTIQVMTADRREYSRNKPFPDMSLPPPGAMAPPPGDFFHNPSDQPFYPPPYHQDESWGGKGGWAPSDIKELTPGPIGPPPSIGMPLGPGMGPPPNMSHPPMNGPPPSYGGSYMHMHHRDMDPRDRDLQRDRDKDGDDGKDDHESDLRNRDRDRSRSNKPDSRQRDKTHRRDRSRSRSRRHKSRSRSPSSRHRSKKKSSHRKDKEDSD